MSGDCQGFGWVGAIRGLPEGYSRIQAPNQINIFDNGIVRKPTRHLKAKRAREFWIMDIGT